MLENVKKKIKKLKKIYKITKRKKIERDHLNSSTSTLVIVGQRKLCLRQTDGRCIVLSKFFTWKQRSFGKNHQEYKVLRIAQRMHWNFVEAYQAIFSILKKFTIWKILKIFRNVLKKIQFILSAILRTLCSW